MTLKSIYERFLSAPNPLSLSESATLHYVTTLTSFTQQGPIIRHLENQNKNVVKKKSEKIITAVEGYSSIALEVETSLEFVQSGGAYLPGLDNFIVDRTATFPITHIVQFDGEEKINQIRLSWDQGALLKQVEVIGKSGRNWPIFDGKDQLKIITSSSKSAASVAPSLPPSRGRTDEHNDSSYRNPSPSKKYIKDPHASLDVFEPPKDDENRRPPTSGSGSVAPRESAKPPPREYSELFAAGHEDHAPSPNGSPNKAHRDSYVAPKGAGARKFENSRLFESDQDYKEPKIYKTNPARYNHFDIGDPQENDAMQYKPGSEQEHKNVPMVARSKKAGSQWNFEDFATPAKVSQRYRESDQVHFSFEDQDNKQGGNGAHGKPRKDADTHFDFIDAGTPFEKRPTQPKPRKDAETHFDFTDDPTPQPRRIIGRNKAALGLYSNPLEDEDEYGTENKAPLSSITNNAGRKKQFDSHWDDDNHTPDVTKKTAAAKARDGLRSNWDF